MGNVMDSLHLVTISNNGGLFIFHTSYEVIAVASSFLAKSFLNNRIPYLLT